MHGTVRPTTHPPSRAVLLACQLSFVGAEEGAALAGQKGQIELVVGEGVEVFLPMAGLFDAGEQDRWPAEGRCTLATGLDGGQGGEKTGGCTGLGVHAGGSLLPRARTCGVQ